MNYLRITKDNIDKEHICCAMSGKQCLKKKEWLKQRFDEVLIFYRSEEHGIPLKVIHLTTKEAAQNVPAPVTTYALFRDGEFVTQSIQSDKKFLALSGIKI